MPSNSSFIEMIKIGGPVMYVLILCSIISVAAIVERSVYFYRRSRVSREAFIRMLRDHLAKGELDHARTMCQSILSPSSAVAIAGINSVKLGEKEIVHAMEREIVIEASALEKRTALIGTIGSTAVYIGLLGTVLGIIQSFQDIAQIGTGGINVVIRGISQALVCTAMGLFVAIPAVGAYNYFIHRINGFIKDMELCASEMESLLKIKKKESHEKSV